MIKYTDLLKLCIVASLVLNPIAHAAPKANGNGNSSSNGNSNSGGGNGGQSGAVNNGGTTTGGSTTGLNGGNNGSGVGNTGPGNQGNDKPVGNAGGSTGSSTGGSTGSSTGGSNGNANSGSASGGSSTGSSTGGSTGSSDNGNTGGFSGGNNGNGVGNTGPGNQGNDTSNGNAGGTTGSSTGGSSTGSSNGGSNGNANSGSASGGSSTGSSDNGNTGGFSGGNNGNGVGNTGPGNQGNDTSNGNAGGTTGSSTGGSSTGGSNGNANSGGSNGNANSGGSNGNANSGGSNGNANSGGSNGNANSGGSNGNSDNGNTGGFSGGNNGNGNGNTGPGNQGNDGSNGNACGNNCTTGSTNGGTTGSTTGSTDGGTTGSTTGSTNGGTSGSTTGSTNGGTSGSTTGSTDGGTTGSVTGSTDGGTTGSTSGGETSGGTTTGGTETTGSTEGGSTTGGETSGGATTGGTETTGGESTGETSGGDSTGGTETTGGETGESTGGETGETSGGETGETSGGETGETNGGTTEAKKEKFKARLLPLAFGNYDIANTAVNLTPADERDLLNNETRLDQYEDGFIVTQMKMWDAGLGAMPQAYIENASGLAALPTAAIGLALTKGRYVQYERLVADEEALNNLKSIPLPLSKKSLDQYQVGESAYFESNGGVLFLAGAGALGAYAGGSVLAEGSFRTLVRKTGANKAIVQIVKANVRTASLYTGAAVLKLDGTRVKQLSHGFNYEFDFNRGGILTVKAFEQLVAGNVSAAQKQALTPDLSGVSRVSDSKSLEVTKKRGVSLGIPMVAIYNWAAGKTYGETATKTYADRTTTDLNYGVYFKEEKGRFFHKHKKITRSFYATKAVTKDEKAKVLATNEEANYFWSYENDAASSGSLNSAMALFHKDLGLKSAFNPSVARGEKLRFVRLQANVKIPENYIRKLISESVAGRGRGEMQRDAQALISRYFANGDEADLCRNDDDGSAIADCQQGLVRESMSAVNRIQATLANLKDKKDASSYTYSIALMGKELVKNQFVMNAFFAQDKSCSVSFDVKLEGRRLSRMMTTIPANKNCRR